MTRSQFADALSMAAVAMAAVAMAAVFVAQAIFLGEASTPWIAGAALLQFGRVLLDRTGRDGRR